MTDSDISASCETVKGFHDAGGVPAPLYGRQQPLYQAIRRITQYPPFP